MKEKEEKKEKVVKDYKLKSTIVSVSTSDKYKDRVNFTLATQFLSYDENGTETKSDTFTLDSFALARQLGAVNFPLKPVVLAFSNGGKSLCVEALAMLLIGAEVEIDRVFHEQGEEREYGEGETYNHDTFATKIKSISAAMPDAVTAQIVVDVLKASKQQQPQVAMRPAI